MNQWTIAYNIFISFWILWHFDSPKWLASQSFWAARSVLWIELNWSCDMEHAHGRDVFRNYEMEELCWEHSGEQSWVENEIEKREEHWTLRASRKHWVENSWTYLCMDLFCVCCSCNLFSLLIYVLQKIQRAELFSKFSIPQDTQIISTILGENEQCFPNKA